MQKLKKVLFLLLPVIALAGGAIGGTMLAPKAAPEDQEHAATEGDLDAEAAHDDTSDSHGDGEHSDTIAWFSFPNQFFVPIVRRGNIDGMVVLTLTLETTQSHKESLEKQEHRLRDALLRTLIVHANSGGFNGNFTADSQLGTLRDALLSASQGVAGDKVHAVLIEDIGLAGS